MGKSRLGLKSNALKRQKDFFNKDQSRLERNELIYSEEFGSASSTAPSAYVADHNSSTNLLLCENYLEDLCHKRKSIREEALQKLIVEFEKHVLNEFVQSRQNAILMDLIFNVFLLVFLHLKYITLTYRCLKLMTKGPTTEAYLACRVIGLLALTVDNSNAAHEIMKESVPQLCEAFKSGSNAFKILVLQCLAIVTFVGASSPDAVQLSMKYIWETCNSADSTHTVLAAALSAWSFLLSAIDGWRIHSEYWKGSVLFLSTLLEKDQHSLCVAVAEAVALISEIDRINNFSEEACATSVESLKCRLCEKIKKLYEECEDRIHDKEFLQNILQYFETGVFDEVIMKTSSQDVILKVSKWSQMIQMRHIKHFLQSGFSKHMKDNERLQDIFKFIEVIQGNHRVEKIFALTSADPKERMMLRNRQRSLSQMKHFSDLCL
ncbi:Interferon-related developmental regulator [Musa troglodytarum]|uniref:Interferon-related developmental regulator n=1 Tax=Musa troglodytarum TaxID=320322 RepID=A0A9E7KCQ8_9LILI|nr:Interferon-related developmental regulator [Musa troglodytarum]